jgi:cell division protein FtsI/penicillin-binding protein 2
MRNRGPRAAGEFSGLGPMAKQLQFRRLLLAVVAMVLGFAGLGFRLVQLQVLRHEELTDRARENTQIKVLMEPRRGDILDRKGNLLATSVFVKTVCADPVLIGSRQTEVARAVAPLLGLDETELAQRIMPRLRQNEKGAWVTNRYVVLKRKVSPETWEKVRVAMKSLTFGVDESSLPKSQRRFYQTLREKAVFTESVDDQLRVYPGQTLAAHVLGYVGMTERELNGSRILETSGKDGLELTLNSKLSGVRGWRLTEADRQRREIVSFRDQDVEPRDGLNVVLTLDSVIQHIVESALAEAMERHAPVSVSAIVVRPRTGEILAMATLPTFDPNRPGDAPADARRNRVITDVAEPGSTFKAVVVSGALNDGVVRLSDVFDCEHGRFYYGGRPLHDHDSYGLLSVANIIAKSSNIGAAKIGIRMGEKRVYDYILGFGFGVRTGIPLPGEVGGIVHPVNQWSKVTIAQLPMGHGLAVTQLQMTMAIAAIANGGWLMRPMLVDRLEDPDHHVVARYSPQRVRQVISQEAARTMIEALKLVATTNGTAPKAALEHYTVAGKTGTAQKVVNGVYVRDKHYSSFIGFLPADNPELCISVSFDEPSRHGYYGGVVPAPVFRQIAERAANYLNIRPDRGEELTVPSEPVSLDDRPVGTASARSL